MATKMVDKSPHAMLYMVTIFLLTIVSDFNVHAILSRDKPISSTAKYNGSNSSLKSKLPPAARKEATLQAESLALQDNFTSGGDDHGPSNVTSITEEVASYSRSESNMSLKDRTTTEQQRSVITHPTTYKLNQTALYVEALAYVAGVTAEESLNMTLPPYTTVVRDSPGMVMLVAPLRISCDGRCGDDGYGFYCSCDRRCLVLNCCCDDFQTLCPEIYSEATETFTASELANLPVSARCVEQFNTVLITECPQKSTATDSICTPAGDIKEDWGTQDWESVTSYGLHQMLTQRQPYTDAATGIHFINKCVFDCYASARSVPTPWKIQLGTIVYFDIPQSVNELNKAVNLSDITFVPPPMIRTISCHPQALSDCPENTSTSARTLCVTESYMPVSQVLPPGHLSTQLFRNVPCALCHIGKNDSSVLALNHYVSPIRDNKFRVFMSVGQNGKVELVSDTLFYPNWKRIKCDLDSDEGACQLLACKNVLFDIDPFRKCRSKKKLTLRIEDLGLNTVEEVEQIRRDLMCHLHQHLHCDIMFQESEVNQVFVDLRGN